MTNGDYIRNMTNAEMATGITKVILSIFSDQVIDRMPFMKKAEFVDSVLTFLDKEIDE